METINEFFAQYKGSILPALIMPKEEHISILPVKGSIYIAKLLASWQKI